MGSKVNVFLILIFLATLLLVSSAATKVAETSNTVNMALNGTIGNHGGEGGELSGYEGGEHGGYEHGGHEHGGEHHKREERGHRERGYYGHKRGHYCHYGCCGRSFKKCRRCCTFAGEKADAEP